MYDDFSYIADEQFLENYWNAEKMLSSYYSDLRKLASRSQSQFDPENVTEMNRKESDQDTGTSYWGACLKIAPV